MKAVWAAAAMLSTTVLLVPAPSPASDRTDGAAAAQSDSATGSVNAQEDKPGPLTIASWGGAYGKSQQRAFITPFSSETGIEVSLVSHGGRFAGLEGGSGGTPDWDVVDMGHGMLDKACSAGQLERIAASEMGLSEEDFFPGALHDCGVASVAWSSTIFYDRRTFDEDKPKTAADLFDTEKFPGKRALPKDPKYLLPLALMADGIDPYYVYRHLETESGVKRALSVLDKVKPDAVWWKRSHRPIELLAEKEAAMGVAFNGRIFYAIVRDAKPFEIIWDAQIYDLDMWAVPKGSPNKQAALKFIAFSVQPDRLAEQTRWFPYGPMRRAALSKVGKHAQVDIEMRAYLPTAEANFERALQVDGTWWAANADRLTKEFETWLAKPVVREEAPENEKAKAGAASGKAGKKKR